MASLFGSSTTTQPKPNLFGSLNTSQPAQSTGLFGQPATTTQNTTGGLFGSSQNKPTLSLFGSTNANNASASNTTGGGLFGNTQQQQQPQQQQATGLFGSTNQQAQPQPGGGLFGSTNQQPQQQQPSLFGSTNQQPQQQQQPQPSLFGSTTHQPQQQQQQQTSLFGGSMLGNTQQQTQPSLFGQSQQQQAQQQPQQSLNFGATLGGSVNNSSIWTPGQNMVPREKSIPSQMETLIGKWNPQSPTCAFEHYFYNQVSEEQAPYFAPGPGEDEKKWEEALKDKPTPGSIPVLARGALQLGKRLEVQALGLRGLQSKLHELNDVLNRRLQAHDLQYSVRAVEARRRHIVLSRRCLALATKVQLLRNKGYTLDANEEQLKSKIGGLWDQAFDPVFSGRQEEIWARLSVLRERANQLQKETEDLARQVDTGKDGTLDPAQIKKVEKILSTYEAQLNLLNKERAAAEQDFMEWQKNSPGKVLR